MTRTGVSVAKMGSKSQESIPKSDSKVPFHSCSMFYLGVISSFLPPTAGSCRFNLDCQRTRYHLLGTRSENQRELESHQPPALHKNSHNSPSFKNLQIISPSSINKGQHYHVLCGMVASSPMSPTSPPWFLP